MLFLPLNNYKQLKLSISAFFVRRLTNLDIKEATQCSRTIHFQNSLKRHRTTKLAARWNNVRLYGWPDIIAIPVSGDGRGRH